jgi:uncharacterized protein (TIGR02588 family)
MTSTESQDDSPPQKLQRTPAEWVAFGIASLVVAIISALVIYLWVSKQDNPPELAVTQHGEIRATNGQFYVPFQIKNQGGETAESIQVVAELRVDGKVEETGEQQIDFLSSQEIEEGAFVFSRNPNRGELNLRVASYRLP